MVHGKGVNDMPRGWASANELNKRIYNLWQHMLRRCYNINYQNQYPTYKGCWVCDKWLKLSGFVEEIELIENYNFWLQHPNERVALDKDIKSNGINKCYCLEQCMFVSNSDNVKQANTTRDYENMKGSNNPMYGKHLTEETKAKLSASKKGKRRYGQHHASIPIIQLTKKGEFVREWSCAKEAGDTLNVDNSGITACCKGRQKSAFGFVWKYLD